MVRARTKFLEMFYKLPETARKNLIFNAYDKKPMTLSVIAFEVRNNTSTGRKLLEDLGYTNDKPQKKGK